MAEKNLLSTLQEVEKLGNRRLDVKCAVGVFLEKFEAKERVEYERILDNREVQATRISQALAANGYDISAFKIRYHRKRFTGSGCSCQ